MSTCPAFSPPPSQLTALPAKARLLPQEAPLDRVPPPPGCPPPRSDQTPFSFRGLGSWPWKRAQHGVPLGVSRVPPLRRDSTGRGLERAQWLFTAQNPSETGLHLSLPLSKHTSAPPGSRRQGGGLEAPQHANQGPLEMAREGRRKLGVPKALKEGMQGRSPLQLWARFWACLCGGVGAAVRTHKRTDGGGRALRTAGQEHGSTSLSRRPGSGCLLAQVAAPRLEVQKAPEHPNPKPKQGLRPPRLGPYL